MSGGRPRTAIGTYGAVYVMHRADRCVAETRFRDLDGRLRKVTATAGSASAAKAVLKERLLDRHGFGSGGPLSPGRASLGPRGSVDLPAPSTSRLRRPPGSAPTGSAPTDQRDRGPET